MAVCKWKSVQTEAIHLIIAAVESRIADTLDASLGRGV